MSSKFPNNYIYVNDENGGYKMISQDPRLRYFVEKAGFDETAIEYIMKHYYEGINRIEELRLQQEIGELKEKIASLRKQPITIPEFEAKNYFN